MLLPVPFEGLGCFVFADGEGGVGGVPVGALQSVGDVAVFEQGVGLEAADAGESSAAVEAVCAEDGGLEVEGLFGLLGDGLMNEAFVVGVGGGGAGGGIGDDATAGDGGDLVVGELGKEVLDCVGIRSGIGIEYGNEGWGFVLGDYFV